MILGRGSDGGGDRSTSTNKLIPPTHVSYHKSVGASMQSIMTDITNEDNYGGGMRMSQRHLPPIDTSKEPSYEEDYDNMSWRGYVQEIEERDQEVRGVKKDHSQFTVRSTSSRLQILEEVEIGNTTTQLSQNDDHDDEEVKTVNDNIKDKTMISPDSNIKQSRECVDDEGSPNNDHTGGFFKMGNFFGRRRHHNHYSSEPSSPPRPLCAANQRTKSQPCALQSSNGSDYTRMLEEEVIRLKLELAYAQTQSDQHQLSMHKLTEERDKLLSSNTELTLLNTELSQTNATQMVQISGLQQHKDILTQKCDKLSQEYIKSQTELKSIHTQNENLIKKSNEQDVVIFYLQENIEKTNKEKDELLRGVANATSQDMSRLLDANISISGCGGMDWQNSINESQNSATSDNKTKPAHLLQMELNEVTMKNQYLQVENKQLKELIQDSDITSTKRRPLSTSLESHRSKDVGHDRSTMRASSGNHTSSYHTVISNTIQEVENFCIQQQQPSSSTSPAIRQSSYRGGNHHRSDMFDDNVYSYNATSYVLPTSSID